MPFFKNLSIVDHTVNLLIEGKDYRTAIINEINLSFFDFTIGFFKEVLDAKFNNKSLDLSWYRDKFILNNSISTQNSAINAGINLKTIKNIYRSTKKEIVLDIAESNLNYLTDMVSKLEQDSENSLAISIKLSCNNISVELTLTESLLVINALATKKIALRGGAWSAIGKRVEKPLLDKLCNLCNVPKKYIDNSHFQKDPNLGYDREVDYILKNKNGQEYRIEVKLMGAGNPESADAVIARDSQIFIADTLSEQNRNQLAALNVAYMELKDNPNVINDFKQLLSRFDIPHS